MQSQASYSTIGMQRHAQTDSLLKSLQDRRHARAQQLDRAADAEIALGHLSIGERLSRTADDLRGSA